MNKAVLLSLAALSAPAWAQTCQPSAVTPYLNINGTIQSGMPEWGVTIPESITVSIGGAARSLAYAASYYASLSEADKAKAPAIIASIILEIL